MSRPDRPLRAALFASGSGTNAAALLDRERRGAAWRSVLLVSDRPDAGALTRAADAGVPTRVVPDRDRPADEVARETLDALTAADVEVVFLAGYLRLVPAAVVEAFAGLMINVHPALLPAFGGQGMWGRRVHEAVLASGARVSGPTIHFVDACYDEGALLAQWPVPVRPDDTPDTLAARVLAAEHVLYPLAAEHLCRALACGRTPGPFAPPGEAFALVDADDGASTLHDLDHHAFGER